MSTSTVRAAESWAVTKRTGMSPPDSRTIRSLAGLASTDATTPSVSAVGVPHGGSDQLVHPQHVGHVLERFGLELDATQAVSGVAVEHALELHDVAVGPEGRRPDDRQGAAVGRQLRARVDTLGLVGPELDDYLAAQTVGLGDPADFEQISRRRCPRWPGRRPWRRPR